MKCPKQISRLSEARESELSISAAASRINRVKREREKSLSCFIRVRDQGQRAKTQTRRQSAGRATKER
jgi:hypothetical protein